MTHNFVKESVTADATEFAQLITQTDGVPDTALV